MQYSRWVALVGISACCKPSPALAQSGSAALVGSAPPATTASPSTMTAVTAVTTPASDRLQRHALSLLAVGGTAFGVGLSAGWQRFGVELDLGYKPILFTYRLPGSETEQLSLIGALDVAVLPHGDLAVVSPRATLGAAFGYRYDSVLRHGIQAGLFVRYGLSKSLELRLLLGPVFYPSAAARIREHEHFAPTVRISAGFAAFQGFTHIALAFRP